MKNAATMIVVAAISCTGCSNIKVTPGARLGEIHTVHLVTEHETLTENDEHMKRALESWHLTVATGPSRTGNNTDLTVTYEDKWNWDVEAYLRALYINFFDGHTDQAVASGQWNDTRVPYAVFALPFFFVAPWAASSPGHRTSLEQVANDLLSQMFAKLEAQTPR